MSLSQVGLCNDCLFVIRKLTQYLTPTRKDLKIFPEPNIMLFCSSYIRHKDFRPSVCPPSFILLRPPPWRYETGWTAKKIFFKVFRFLKIFFWGGGIEKNLNLFGVFFYGLYMLHSEILSSPNFNAIYDLLPAIRGQ